MRYLLAISEKYSLKMFAGDTSGEMLAVINREEISMYDGLNYS